MTTQKIYIRPGVDQKLYFRMVDATQSTPTVPVYFETGDGDPFIPTIQGETAPISFRLAQNDPVDVYTPNIYYVARRLQFCYEIDSTLLTDYGTGDIVIIDDRLEPVFIEFEVVHESDYGATFSQVAALSTSQQTVENALSAYGVPTNSQIVADISSGLTTYGVPAMSALNNLSAAQVLAAFGTYGAAKTSDLTGLTTGLATQASLTTVSNAVSGIKAITDLLTRVNIETWASNALTNNSIPGSLNTISQNILNAKAVTDLLTLASISNAVWNNSDRELTSGTGSGPSAEEFWDYPIRTITSTPADGATAAEISSLNNISTTQVYTQIINALSNAGLLTQAQMTTLLAPIATQASLTTVGNNVSAIQSITNNLTLANIKTQSANALTDASIPASLTQANNNITAIENIVSPLTKSAIAQTIWEYVSRSLTTAGTGGGATITEISSLLDSKQLATIAALTADFATQNNLSQAQVYSQVLTAIQNSGLLTSSTLTTAISPLAKEANLDSVASSVATILSNTNLITPNSVYTQTKKALDDESISGSLAQANNNILAVLNDVSPLTLKAISDYIWLTATSRTLTSQGSGGGATITEISSLLDSKQLATLAVIASLSSDMLTANGNISSIKGKTDLLTLAAIANQVWTNASRTLTSSPSGGITTQDLQAGLTSYGVATSANITVALTTLTTDINQLNDISVNDLLNTVIEGTYTLVQIIRLLASEAAGNGSKTDNTITYKSLDGSKNRITATCTDTSRSVLKDVS